MGDSKFNLKSITATALIITCAALTFWGLSQNENSFETKTSPTDFTGHAGSLPPGHVLSAPSKTPAMPKGFNPNTIWRNPFAVPAEIAGAGPQAAPPPIPTGTAGGNFNPPGTPLLEHVSDLPSLAGIVSSGGRQIAIIRHKGFSRAYSEGEQAGNYRLVQIAENTVILENHAGEPTTLRLP